MHVVRRFESLTALSYMYILTSETLFYQFVIHNLFCKLSFEKMHTTQRSEMMQ